MSIFCGFMATTAWCEMPPSAYISLQHDAPEALDVEIISAQQTKSETKEAFVTSVILQAKVLKVKRTATQLKAGANITINYDHRESKIPGWVGPSEIPILAKGDKCPAYLKQMSGTPAVYQPAARGYTFETVKR